MNKVTGNAQLLLGYIAGLVIKDGETGTDLPLYTLTEVDAAAGSVVIKAHSGNAYRLSIAQIGGVE